jgi:hypothetical protein
MRTSEIIESAPFVDRRVAFDGAKTAGILVFFLQ